MSKLRQNLTPVEGDLTMPEEGDLRGYVIFTQLKADGPFIYAGWLDAADDAMALSLAPGALRPGSEMHAHLGRAPRLRRRSA